MWLFSSNSPISSAGESARSCGDAQGAATKNPSGRDGEGLKEPAPLRAPSPLHPAP